MCGIFGLIERRGVDPRVLVEMGRLLQHRGPDGEGFVVFDPQTATATPFGAEKTPANAYTLGTPAAPKARMPLAPQSGASIGLGHRRLSIVDLSAHGHQPMASADARHWITYNGEIYNHVELRAELESAGHRFDSHSDTEVVLAAYRQWGSDCLRRFNGMWAFVIYDVEARTFFIARDRFGVKPLYYWSNGQTFAMASEIKAFLAHPDFRPRPATGYLKHYLLNGPAEYLTETAFEGVLRVRPSHFIVATAEQLLDQTFEARRWWQLEPDDSNAPFSDGQAQDLADQYLAILEDAVALRLRADVTVGSALSGGLDSSSIVYLIAEQIRKSGSSRQQETFSSVYKSQGTRHCDESGYIEQVGAQLKVRLNTIEPHAADVPSEHERMIWCMDTPPESTCMSGWHTFKLVNSRGIKVTLDGQGADEQLAGYLTYLPIHLAQMGARSLGELPGLLNIHPPRVALGAVAAGLVGRSASRMGLAKLMHGRRARVVHQLGHSLNAALAEDCFAGLSNLIHYGDRASMAFGVESRMPFLDYRLAEFLARVPAAFKIHDGWTKYLARRAFDGKLPREVIWRKDKMGWPIPEQTWEQGPLAEWFARPRLARERMAELGLGEEFNAALDSRSIVARVRTLNLQSWHALFIEGGWTRFR